MANFKGPKFEGKGSMTQQSLIVHMPPNGIVYAKDKEGNPTKGIKGRYLDIQLDQSLRKPEKIAQGQVKGIQKDPHLTNANAHFKAKDGKTKYFTSHREFYSTEQIDKMQKAAGKKIVTGKDKSVTMGITANIMSKAPGHFIINTSKEMGPTKNPYFGKNIMEKQDAVTKAMQDYSNKQYEAQKAAEKTADKPAKEHEVKTIGPEPAKPDQELNQLDY